MEVVRVYSKATELVNQYLAPHDTLPPKSVKKAILELNKKIKKINQESGHPEDKELIKVHLLFRFACSYREAGKKRRNNPEDLIRIQKQFNHVKKIFYYPSSWQLPNIPGITANPPEIGKGNLVNQEAAKRIIGYIPSSGFCGPSFIIENPSLPTGILIEQYSNINSDMARAYLTLPEAEKKDIHGSQERYSKTNRTKYNRILG